MRTRLLYLLGQLGGGGSERQLYSLLKAMDRVQYRPAVAVWNFSEKDVFVQAMRRVGIPVYALPNTPSPISKLSVLRRLIREVEAEIVHSYTFYTNVAAYLATRGTGAIAIGSIRGEFPVAKRDSGAWLGRLSARWPRDQISNSFAAAQACCGTRDPFVPNRVAVVRNGLDLDDLRCPPPPQLGMPHIAGIGSLVPAKRWDRLCRLAVELKRKGVECLVHIAGDGRLRSTLEAQARHLGIADRVRFVGYADDVSAVLGGARCLVHVSDTEGCPNVVMEAMACGRAVIATNVGDVASLIEDGKTGFVVDRRDEDALLDRVITVLTNYDLCRRMGEAGRRKANREFGLERLVSETLAAYRAMGWRDA